jgi:hypothetical protein
MNGEWIGASGELIAAVYGKEHRFPERSKAKLEVGKWRERR